MLKNLLGYRQNVKELSGILTKFERTYCDIDKMLKNLLGYRQNVRELTGI